MVNQRLISQIRRGMARRIPLEKIRIDMLGMGFSNSQFDNAMAEINAGSPMVKSMEADKSSLADVSKKSRMFVWIGIIGGLLLIGGIVLFFIFTGGDSDDSLGVPPEELECTTDFDCGVNFICEVGECVEEPEVEIPDQEGLVNCGDDYVCFISAAEVCEKAQVLRTTTLEIFGVVSTSLIHEIVRGESDGKCLYAQKTIDSSLYFSEELVQQLLDSGQTQEEISQAEQEINEGSGEFLNLEHECKFDTGDLSAMLNRWNEGTIDGGTSCIEIDGGWDCTYTGDWALGEDCTSITVP